MEGLSFWTPVWHRNTLAQWSDRLFNFGSQVAVINTPGDAEVTLRDRSNPPVWIAARAVLIAGSILMSLQKLVSTKQLSNLRHLPAAVLTALFLAKVYYRWGMTYEVSKPPAFDMNRLAEVLATLPPIHASVIRVAAQGMGCLVPKQQQRETWKIYLDKPKQYPVQIQDTNICWFGALLDELRREDHPDAGNSYTAMSASFAIVRLALYRADPFGSNMQWDVIRDALSMYARIPATQKDFGVNDLPTIRENYNTLIDLLKPYQKPADWNFIADTAVAKSSLPQAPIENATIESLIQIAQSTAGIRWGKAQEKGNGYETCQRVKGIMQDQSNPLDVFIGTNEGNVSTFAIRVTDSNQERVNVFILDDPQDKSKGWWRNSDPIFDQDNLKALIENSQAIDASGKQWSLCSKA